MRKLRKKLFKSIIKIVILLLVAFFVLALILPAFAEGEILENMRGKVVTIISEVELEDGGTILQMLEVRISKGTYRNQIITIEHATDPNTPAFGKMLKVGDGVYISALLDENGDIISPQISNIVKDKYLVIIMAFFVCLLIIIGRLKGVKSLVSLIITIALVLGLLVPLLLRGYNPVPVALGVSVLAIIFTLLIVNGLSEKSLSAIIGTASGMIIAGLLAVIVGSLAKLTGYNTQESFMLDYIPDAVNFNHQGILFAGMIIGALGAVMDVGMSIASSIHEIKLHNPSADVKSLFTSGMNIGKDIMGTMSNTLILAYTGSSLMLIMVVMAYNTSLIDIFNLDSLATEVIRAIAGSIGLLCTIPITAITAAVLESRMHKSDATEIDVLVGEED